MWELRMLAASNCPTETSSPLTTPARRITTAATTWAWSSGTRRRRSGGEHATRSVVFLVFGLSLDRSFESRQRDEGSKTKTKTRTEDEDDQPMTTQLETTGHDWRIGLAAADITPQEPIWLGGYGARSKPSEGVLDPLCAKAMAMESDGERAVVITTDLISFDAAFADVVLEDIRQRTGLAPRQVILNSSHTHAGPVFGIRYARYYGLDPDQPGPTARYNALLRARLPALVEAALADLKPARLSWATGAAPFAMNRRRYTPKGVVNAPYPRGYVDRSVPVLRVDGPDGRLRGVLFGYACHNTTVGSDNYRISSEYAGFAQRYVERVHPGAQAMFLMGCGADANPYPRGTYELARQHGETLGAEVCRVLQQE
ncbi:MAG: hypothetical protein FJ272_19090, partial [Planctomycetes bacterium]|nr:hypothetical protein [Planctomycetota bacterium]